MPYDEPDLTDPTILIGVEAPANEDSDAEMAYVFAEEFARMGFSEQRLLALFHHPFYAGAYRTLRVLGEERILSIILETLEIWGRFRPVIVDAPESGALDVSLDVLRQSVASNHTETTSGGNDESSV